MHASVAAIAAATTCLGPKLFVASDDVDDALYLPSRFFRGGPGTMPQLLRDARDCARTYDAKMRDAVATEGWPPPASSGRVRAKSARCVDAKKGETCWRCGELYGRIWVNRGVCFHCEALTRDEGVCPFHAKCRDKRAGFCHHQQRCFKCDARTSCAKCRFHTGDGDDVLALARHVGAHKIFLDWDRTFCSTKSGADPMKGDHELDGPLLEYAQQHPANVVVVTRSSAKRGIELFLEKNHVSADLAVRSVKQEKIDKYDAIDEYLTEGQVAVFADDDINELTDPRVDADARIHRVLFLRG